MASPAIFPDHTSTPAISHLSLLQRLISLTRPATSATCRCCGRHMLKRDMVDSGGYSYFCNEDEAHTYFAESQW